jgi:hypothetical protein
MWDGVAQPPAVPQTAPNTPTCFIHTISALPKQTPPPYKILRHFLVLLGCTVLNLPLKSFFLRFQGRNPTFKGGGQIFFFLKKIKFYFWETLISFPKSTHNSARITLPYLCPFFISPNFFFSFLLFGEEERRRKKGRVGFVVHSKRKGRISYQKR